MITYYSYKRWINGVLITYNDYELDKSAYLIISLFNVQFVFAEKQDFNH